MKIVKHANKTTVKISKSEWLSIGKKAGWTGGINQVKQWVMNLVRTNSDELLRMLKEEIGGLQEEVIQNDNLQATAGIKQKIITMAIAALLGWSAESIASNPEGAVAALQAEQSTKNEAIPLYKVLQTKQSRMAWEVPGQEGKSMILFVSETPEDVVKKGSVTIMIQKGSSIPNLSEIRGGANWQSLKIASEKLAAMYTKEHHIDQFGLEFDGLTGAFRQACALAEQGETERELTNDTKFSIININKPNLVMYKDTVN